jgi:hypothetical protein
MTELSRRLFLKRGSLTVAAAGFLSAVPGMPSLLAGLESDSGEASGAGASAAEVGAGGAGEAGSVDGTLIAHVKDLSTGEISVYLGENEYTYRDPDMAAKLLRVTR